MITEFVFELTGKSYSIIGFFAVQWGKTDKTKVNNPYSGTAQQ